jgi:hypothetical protein
MPPRLPGRGGELTAAGLVRRSPKQQIRDLTATPPTTGRTVGSQRTPEEVRRMLSRYRTGLQRGRVNAQQGAAPGGEGPGERGEHAGVGNRGGRGGDGNGNLPDGGSTATGHAARSAEEQR